MKTLMRYYTIAGRVVEERAAVLSSTADRKKPRGVRRAGASSLQKIKRNEGQSVQNLARGIALNFQPGDAFCTCKYDAAHYPGAPEAKDNVPGSPGFEKAAADLARLLRQLRGKYRRQTGRPLHGYWQTANWSPHGPDGGHPARLHQHLVLPSDAVDLLRRLWPMIGGPGTVIVVDLDSDPDRTRLAEYMVSNVRGKTPGMKAWSGSTGMLKPVVSEPEEISSIEELAPPPGAVIKDVREITDEDGRVVGKYLRYVLPAPPKIRGGQIVLPRPPKRGGRRVWTT